MRPWSRRDLLKTGLGAAGACALGPDVARALGVAAPAGEVGAAALPAMEVAAALPGAAEGWAVPAAQGAGRERLLLDFDWRFHLGHASDPAKDFGFSTETWAGAYAKQGYFLAPSKPDFDVQSWRQLDLPHDWAVELPFVEDRSLTGAGSKPLGRAHPATSIGWYRKELQIPAGDAGRRLWLEFDGVFRDAIAALNGCMLGRNQSGYAPVRYDVTDVVNYGGRNVLVVRVDATEREGWFYEGAGIYRHVWLVKAPPVHVSPWGVYVTTPEVGRGSALVRVVTEVANEAGREATCRVVSMVQDAGGREVDTARSGTVRLGEGARVAVTHELRVPQPKLWSPDTPYLYRLVTTVETAGAPADGCETSFGIRTVQFDADRGLLLNGERLEIKGTCNHQDHAGVGAALPDRLQSYRIERLKTMGSNAYRTSHNPPTPELLDACDRLGMMVLDENRFFSSDAEGRSQLERLILRDRNHPCVIAWSLGNEEFALEYTPTGGRIAASLQALAHRLDPSRVVSMPMAEGWGSPMSEVIDVQGLNYEQTEKPARNIPKFRAKFPHKPVMGTEVGSTFSTRGVYANTSTYLSCYDVNAPEWGQTAHHWVQRYAEFPFLAGGFVWTGFDYRGEPTPNDWPNINSQFGILDTCGFPKDNFWYYKAVWSSEPVLHLFPHWNWAGKEGKAIEVWCHSNLDRVELLVNGRSLGSQPVPKLGHVQWSVPYAPGYIEARGFRGAQRVASVRRETTGPAARVELRPDRRTIEAGGQDVAVVEVRIVDSRGRLVPTADHDVTFHVSGAGRLIGVGNGDPASHEPDKADRRKAFNGLCAAILQSARTPGACMLEATSPGLKAGRLEVPVTATA